MSKFALESARFGQSWSTDGFDQWRKICVESFLGDLVRPVLPHEDFGGEVRRRWVDDTLVIRFRTSPYHVKFRPASGAGDYVGFQVASAPPTETVRWHDRAIPNKVTGALGIWDNAAVERATFSTQVNLTCILVPKVALQTIGVRVGRFASPISVDHKPTASMLASMLDSVLSMPGNLTLADAVSIRNAALELLAGAAREDIAQVASGAVSAPRKQAVQEWVAAQLSRGQISPVEAAAAHGISVRSLHRLFSDSGTTFGEMVRSLRLDRAKRDLASNAGTVQAVAAHWGYADLSHFCREFKRSFGMTTTEFRDQCSPKRRANN